MKNKRIIVISLGGSLIVPNNVNYKFLEKFKKTISSLYKEYKFIIVTGGGSIARKYIQALKSENKSKLVLSEAGIRATKLNAQFLIQFFGKEANDILPKNMKEVKNNIHKNNVVICGALRYTDNSTSDTTSAKLAHFLKTIFINITNVNGLYTDNPKTNPKAKLIKKISWKDFEKMALKTKFSPGQHFVLDQQAAVLIKKYKIPTYIIGKNLKNLKRLLNNKDFGGTEIKE